MGETILFILITVLASVFGLFAIGMFCFLACVILFTLWQFIRGLSWLSKQKKPRA